MNRTFIEALKLAIENKDKSYSYSCAEKAEGYVCFSTLMNKAMFISYGIVCSFTEDQAKKYIKEGLVK